MLYKYVIDKETDGFFLFDNFHDQVGNYRQEFKFELKL